MRRHRGAPARGPSSRRPRRATRDGCYIKGNINARGDKIYHTPSSPSYEETVIDESRGERWFCTETEAGARAGARRAADVVPRYPPQRSSTCGTSPSAAIVSFVDGRHEIVREADDRGRHPFAQAPRQSRLCAAR